VEYSGGGALDFWIDAARPHRVIQRDDRINKELTVCEFEPADADNPIQPIPIRITQTSYRPGYSPSNWSSQRFETIVERRETRFNVPIPPETFTMAGMGLSIGTMVMDPRRREIVGYWDGTNIAKNQPRNAEPRPRTPGVLASALWRVVEEDPKSALALHAASHMIVYSPDAPEVDKAVKVIEREHITNEKLEGLCARLEGTRYGQEDNFQARLRYSTNLLRAILAANPHSNVQANASFTLAKILKRIVNADESAGRTNAPAREEAIQLFSRLIGEFGELKNYLDGTYSNIAAQELDLLGPAIAVGRPAPEIDEVDTTGRLSRLSDYRGKVVALVFTIAPCDSCATNIYPKLRDASNRWGAEQFEVAAVFNTWSKPEAIRKGNGPWRCWWDRRGDIFKNWTVKGWPVVYLIDRDGIVRYRNVLADNIPAAVESLIHEK
jgi:peroxiredoxin